MGGNNVGHTKRNMFHTAAPNNLRCPSSNIFHADLSLSTYATTTTDGFKFGDRNQGLRHLQSFWVGTRYSETSSTFLKVKLLIEGCFNNG